jgi:YD repeat-containing protein
VTEADAVFSGTTTYGYDAFNRLTSAINTKVGNLSYAYDLNGNRTSDNGGSFSYNAANELTASPGVSSWSYDGNGNVSGNSAGVSLSYNAKNQITAMTYGGQTISSLAYADLGQTERTQAGGLSFFSSPRGVQIQKSAAQSTFYTRDNKGNLIGERLPGGARWYYLKDGLGSTVAVINESGSTVSNRYGYDPYGKSTSKSESVTNPWSLQAVIWTRLDSTNSAQDTTIPTLDGGHSKTQSSDSPTTRTPVTAQLTLSIRLVP